MNNNTYIHKYLKGLITKNDVVVDMTMGNGNDTLFLCQSAKKVFAFDISDEAINNTYNRVKDYSNAILIKDNHINIDKYVKKDEVKLFIFNLGYLPNSLDTTITKKEETLIAFQKAYLLLKENGYIIITFYKGHIGGKDEFYLLDEYISNNKINILEKYRAFKKHDEPITYVIKK